MWAEDEGYAEITQLPPEVLRAIEQVGMMGLVLYM